MLLLYVSLEVRLKVTSLLNDFVAVIKLASKELIILLCQFIDHFNYLNCIRRDIFKLILNIKPNNAMLLIFNVFIVKLEVFYKLRIELGLVIGRV